MKANEVAQETINAVNGFGFNYKEYAETVANSHRTLQQSWMRAVVETCRVMKEHEKFADDRNAAATELACKIVEWADENGLPMI